MFLFSSRRRHTRCALVTGVQTCALPILALVASSLDPPAMLDRLQAIEAAFGRRTGQRWSARTLDLDILLWSGGIWSDDRLVIPHPARSEARRVGKECVSTC